MHLLDQMDMAELAVKGNDVLNTDEGSIYREIEAEVGRAREKFPSPNPTLLALTEELGEAVEAYQSKRGLEVGEQIILAPPLAPAEAQDVKARNALRQINEGELESENRSYERVPEADRGAPGGLKRPEGAGPGGPEGARERSELQ